MAKADVTPARLRELLYYDPETGVFTWRVRRPRTPAGSVAGSKYKLGRTHYVYITVDGEPYRAHRLAWLYVHGVWPAEFLDHINGDGSDNRMCNLREATCAENSQAPNRRMAARNSSGHMGVGKRSGRTRWSASITVDKQRVWLGAYNTAEEAAAVRQEARRMLHAFHADKQLTIPEARERLRGLMERAKRTPAQIAEQSRKSQAARWGQSFAEIGKATGAKPCRKCGDVKPLEAFGSDPNKTDGKRTRCKLCVAAEEKARRDAAAAAEHFRRSMGTRQ